MSTMARDGVTNGISLKNIKIANSHIKKNSKYSGVNTDNENETIENDMKNMSKEGESEYNNSTPENDQFSTPENDQFSTPENDQLLQKITTSSQQNSIVDNEEDRTNETIVSGCSASRSLLSYVKALKEGKTQWNSIYVASFLGFCCSTQHSLFISSLWPFLNIIDETADERFFGYIVSGYSLGQIIFSPLIGFLSSCCFRKISPLLYGCLALMFIGNSLYLAIETVSLPQHRRYFLLFARFIGGCGASSICLLKTYVSMASASKDRSRAIAFTTGGLALGMMMGPAFQLIFTPIGYPGIRLLSFENSGINLSMYTAPALMACVMNVVNVISIRFLFCEKYASLVLSSKSKSFTTREVKSKKQKVGSPQSIPIIKITSACSNENITEVDDESINFTLPKYDRAAVALCHFSRFTQMFVKTNFDTIGAPLAATFFAWNAKEVIKVLATSQTIMSAIAFLIYLSYIFLHLDKIVNYRKACILSLFALVVFHVVTFPYPFLPRRIQTFNSSSLFFEHKFDENYGNVTFVEQHPHQPYHPPGCDVVQFSWCLWVRAPNPYLFFGTYTLIVGVAFSNLNISLNTLFSKILGPRRQGTQQGILQMSGGAARMIGPLFVSSIYISSGPAMVWILEVIVVFINLLLWIILYRRMIPLRMEGGLV